MSAMYRYAAYAYGRLLMEGHAPSVESVLAQFPGTYELDTELGDEQRFISPGNPDKPVLYIRPSR